MSHLAFQTKAQSGQGLALLAFGDVHADQGPNPRRVQSPTRAIPESRFMPRASHDTRPAVTLRLVDARAPLAERAYGSSAGDPEALDGRAQVVGDRERPPEPRALRVKIHDDVELPKGTGAGGGRKEIPEGPIVLQGHGNPVRYRNIWIQKK